jgi:hypothetical protein
MTPATNALDEHRKQEKPQQSSYSSVLDPANNQALIKEVLYYTDFKGNARNKSFFEKQLAVALKILPAPLDTCITQLLIYLARSIENKHIRRVPFSGNMQWYIRPYHKTQTGSHIVKLIQREYNVYYKYVTIHP